jgi:hypothetical protein
MEKAPAYGTTRHRQANVSYLEIERASLDILATGQRPSVEIIRKHLGRGSPATIAEALRRFWRDLGVRAAGDPAALTRLPVEIAHLADGIWQKALTLASEAAKHEDNAARERLTQLQLENDVRSQSFALREREMDAATRGREQALREAREQIALLMRELGADRETMRAQVARITELSGELQAYRQQLGRAVTRAVAKHRSRVRGESPAKSRVKRLSKAKTRVSPSKLSRSARKPTLKSR